jgi:phospholipid/cholesterol/gamma-HCH transport system ATP-binding protein
LEIIKATNLDVGYDKYPVLKGLDFGIQKEEITVIVGKSGCGKSTLLKTLIGLIPPLGGEIHFNKNRIDFLSEESLQMLYKNIGVLYQSSALLNSLTLYENVALPLRLEYKEVPHDLEEKLVHFRLSQVGLDQWVDKYPSELSGGMRKRAALARALILEPEMVFCDEPSAGLDPITSTGLDELLLNLKQVVGITIVVVTHELRSIEKIADRIIILEDGGLHFMGDFKDIFFLKDPFIHTFFLRKGKDGD